MMENKLKKKILIIFNVILNITWVFLLGIAITNSISKTLVIIILWTIFRPLIGKAKHYKFIVYCVLQQILLFTSLFLNSYVNIILTSLLTLFTVFLLSGRADINTDETENDKGEFEDITIWSGKTSKYDPLRDFVGTSPNNPIILDYEEYWRKNNPIRYEMFIMFYRERKSYEQIKKIKDYDENTIIKNECRSIYEQLEKPLNLPTLKR